MTIFELADNKKGGFIMIVEMKKLIGMEDLAEILSEAMSCDGNVAIALLDMKQTLEAVGCRLYYDIKVVGQLQDLSIAFGSETEILSTPMAIVANNAEAIRSTISFMANAMVERGATRTQDKTQLMRERTELLRFLDRVHLLRDVSNPWGLELSGKPLIEVTSKMHGFWDSAVSEFLKLPMMCAEAAIEIRRGTRDAEEVNYRIVVES